MKCDVCSTKIPLGEHQCPNCGYKMSDKKISPFHVESTTHEHIGTTQQQETPGYKPNNELQESLQGVKKNPKVGTNFVKAGENLIAGKNAKTIRNVLFIIVVMFVWVAIIMGQVHGRRYVDASFQEIIENEDDRKGTVQAALDYENKLIEEFKTIGLTISETDEYCNNDNGLYANTSVSAIVNNIHYSISSSFEEGIMTSNTLFVRGDSQTSLLDEFQGDKDVITKLGKVLGTDNLVDIFDQSRIQLREINGDLVYRNDNPCISITQNQEGSSHLYYFEIMYDFFGY